MSSSSFVPSLKTLIVSYYDWKEQMLKRIVEEILSTQSKDHREIDMLVDAILKVSVSSVNEELDKCYRKKYVKCERPRLSLFEALYYDAKLDLDVMWNLVKDYVDKYYSSMDKSEVQFWNLIRPTSYNNSSSYAYSGSGSGSDGHVRKRKQSYSQSSSLSNKFKFQSVAPVLSTQHKDDKPLTQGSVGLILEDENVDEEENKKEEPFVSPEYHAE